MTIIGASTFPSFSLTFTCPTSSTIIHTNAARFPLPRGRTVPEHVHAISQEAAHWVACPILDTLKYTKTYRHCISDEAKTSVYVWLVHTSILIYLVMTCGSSGRTPVNLPRGSKLSRRPPQTGDGEPEHFKVSPASSYATNDEDLGRESHPHA